MASLNAKQDIAGNKDQKIRCKTGSLPRTHMCLSKTPLFSSHSVIYSLLQTPRYHFGEEQEKGKGVECERTV